MKLRTLNRRTTWALAAALGLGAVSGFAATSARASDLDLRYTSSRDEPIVATTYLRNDDGRSFAYANRPVRRRSPRYEGYGPSTRHSFATLGVGSFDPSDQPGSGLYVNGSIGTELQSPIDLGLSLALYHRSTGGSEYVANFTDPAGNKGTRVIQTSDITTDLVPVMAFVRVKFPLASGVEPYVGAGVGWEWLSVQGTDQAGGSFSDDYDGFGAQFFGGANFTIAPTTSLYAEALYNSSTVSADFYDPFYGTTVRDEIDMNGLAGHAGLRFRF
jgi:opacity protein-like surface antigen